MTWKRSSRCGTSTCVEVNLTGPDVLVRDCKEKDGPALTFTKAEWRSFIEGVKAGEFDV